MRRPSLGALTSLYLYSGGLAALEAQSWLTRDQLLEAWPYVYQATCYCLAYTQFIDYKEAYLTLAERGEPSYGVLDQTWLRPWPPEGINAQSGGSPRRYRFTQARFEIRIRAWYCSYRLTGE